MARKKSTENLIEAGKPTRFKKGVCPNPKGRPKNLSTLVKDLPDDGKVKVANMFWTAISFGSKAKALEFLERMRKENADIECGVILEVAITALHSPQGFAALIQIVQMLFGTPRQTTEATITGNMEYQFKFGDE